MPEYLAPGVHVEEVSFRSKSIEGVATSTTAFIGLTRRGPAGASPRMVTSFSDFERLYGGGNDLALAPAVNYLAHAARAFFDEGGHRLFIARVVAAAAATATTPDLIPGKTCRFRAAFAGEAGNGQVAFSIVATALAREALALAPEGSLVRINRPKPEYAVKHAGVWRDAANLSKKRRLSTVRAMMDLLTLNVTATEKDGFVLTHAGLGFDRLHSRFAGKVLSVTPVEGSVDEVTWFFLELSGDVVALDLLQLSSPTAGQGVKVIPVGSGPGAQAGTDAVPSRDDWTSALARLESIKDIAIVAAPGHTEFSATAEAVTAALVSHAEASKAWRFAVLDVARGRTPAEALAEKARVDSSSAALYYPWVVAANPSGAGEMILPPSGFVCGIYARTDVARGVHKAPAGEVVHGALRFERVVSTGEQEILNPAGVNCLRFFTGRGYQVWGARTTSSDPEWKYINVRRYVIYLEHAIDQGTQWVVFEPNAEPLWATVRQTIEKFLINAWQSGALLGNRPEQAFFVKCDRSTMTQEDLDRGRLICFVGVALLRPAEFVLFRIGQWTADVPS